MVENTRAKIASVVAKGALSIGFELVALSYLALFAGHLYFAPETMSEVEMMNYLLMSLVASMMSRVVEK